MKKNIFIITYIIFSLLFINIKKIESSLAVMKEENIDNYSQSFYILSFKNKKFIDILKYLDDEEIYIIKITPINYKGINITLPSKGKNNSEIYTNFIKDYTNILKDKGYVEEAIYIEQKSINIDKLEILTIGKKIEELKKKLDFEYVIYN